MPTVESLLTIPQVARLTGLSARTIWRMIGESRTPTPVRVGRTVRLRASVVDRWIRLGCPDRHTFEAATKEEVAAGSRSHDH